MPFRDGWRGDGLKDAILRSVYRVGDSLARACISVVEGDLAGKKPIFVESSRILGALSSVIPLVGRLC